MKQFIREILETELKEIMILKESNYIISEGLKYHLDNNLSVSNSIYRYASDKHLHLINDSNDYWNLYLKYFVPSFVLKIRVI